MKRLLVYTATLTVAAAVFFWLHSEYGWPRRSLTQSEQWDLNFLDNSVNDLENPTPLNANIRRIECADPPKNIAHWKSLGAARNKLRRYESACARNSP